MSADTEPPTAEADETDFPSLEGARARLAAFRQQPLSPWLTPEGLAAMAEAVASGIPELHGPVDVADPLAGLPDIDD